MNVVHLDFLLRYGYKTVEELDEVVRGYENAQIPLDTMWTDIDYMNAWRNFTLDPKLFPKDKMQVEKPLGVV